MINNYKAQRNVRAELGGAVDLGEPVSLYIAEDEVKYGAELTQTGDNIKDIPVGTTWAKNATHYGWTAGGNGFDESTPGTVALDAEGGGSIKVFVPANTGSSTHIFAYQDGIVYKAGQQYEIRIMAKASEASRKIRLQTDNTTDDCPLSNNNRSDLNLTTDWAEYKLQWTATATGDPQDRIQIARDNDDSDGWTFYFKDVSVHEVTDHTYKLMAINDTIPASNINAEAEGSEMITNDRNQIFDEAGDWTGYGSPAASTTITGGKLQVTTSVEDPQVTQGAKLGVGNLTAPVVGRTYRIRAWLDDVGTANADAIYKFKFGGSSAVAVTASDGTPNDGTINTENQEYYADVTATNTTGDLEIRIASDSNDAVTTFTIDVVSVKELYGYDYYNAPAYKFGIVSSVYDQSTGAMKTTGAAGDQVEVTVQGECNIIRYDGSNQSVDKDYPIKRIMNDGEVFDGGVVDNMLPNAVGVITETNSSTTTAKAILFQGVEFSESFVHKNSLQVHAKCDETITKFRPVSLFLDSNGDLLCRHDDIPETQPLADQDHTGVDPGKWGIAELGGASGDIIPVTVAGKTTIAAHSGLSSSSLGVGRVIKSISEGGWIVGAEPSDNFTPNVLGTIMETGVPGEEFPFTIFGGTPIGTITNWKRTIKVTAKANGAITQYCPVSLYLDQWGDYRCISDDIPNEVTDGDNGIWVDFRKWGVAQTTVADGEFVEIIVQGRTNVVDAKNNANRTDAITKISSAGQVSATASTTAKLSCLGIVEKEAKTSEGTPGIIIIF